MGAHLCLEWFTSHWSPSIYQWFIRKVHKKTFRQNLSSFLGGVTQAKLTKILNWIKPIQLLPHLCSCTMRRVGFEDCRRLYMDFHPHKSREHLYHTIPISLSNMYEIKLLNEAHVTVLPWIKSEEENENELCCNKERQLSSRKKKLRRRRMNEWMSSLIKGYLTHRSKQKYVRRVGPSPSLIKVYPDYLAGKAAFEVSIMNQ